MRLDKAKSLKEYIEQIEKDLKVLKEIESMAYHYELDFFVSNRESIENHSQILGDHRDYLRKNNRLKRS